MVFRAFLILIMFMSSYDGVIAESLRIKDDHPNQYTVLQGDTLWGISAKFLEHPWQWPQLWKANQQIKNPDLIFPGDTLYFSFVEGVPQISVKGLKQNEVVQKLEPSIRESSIEQAIQIIPTDAIAKFLTSPKVVTQDEIHNASYILAIAGDERLIAGAGDQIYVRGIEEISGLGYTIYRQGAVYTNPETNQLLGYEAVYVGEATLQASGDPATFFINKSVDQIKQGDLLMRNSGNGLALNYFPHSPSEQIVGHIISVMGGITQIGQHDIVVLDKGIEDGLQVGHTFDIYRNGRVVKDKNVSEEFESIKLPDERAGVLLVFRPFEKVSYALVMEAVGPIHILDRVQAH